jgi:nuclear cap-binding protein subunit 1
MVSPSSESFTWLLSFAMTGCRVPDLSLTFQHPKRVFMRRAIEFEIRLSYHDRILKTLPEAMQTELAQNIQQQAPGPDYGYDDPGILFSFMLAFAHNLTRGNQ